MEQITATLAEISARFPPEMREKIMAGLDRAMAMSPEQRLANDCENLNNRQPSPTREQTAFIACYDCEICKNKMKIYYPLDGDIAVKDCACIPIRGSLIRVKNSGLADELRRCKFSTFADSEPWQRDIKARAMAFAKDPKGWLYLCGQVGGGKTHLCTAVVGRLIHSGKSARYMLWKDQATALKARINDREYQDMIDPFLTADVLYIDDFLKTERGEDGVAKRPATGDLNLAFQIVNNRYCSRKTTIISSEHTVDELIAYDQAIGSRVYEMSRNNCVMIPLGTQNNYRMRRHDSGVTV